jgi:hypothetical protein
VSGGVEASIDLHEKSAAKGFFQDLRMYSRVDVVSRTDRSPFSSNRKKAFDRSFFQESLSGRDEASAYLWLSMCLLR